MAIVKKSMEQIAKENNYDISEDNAKRVAEAYIQPTLNSIKSAEQQALANTQTSLKSLESSYFDKYREGLYEAQSRGLQGGLVNLSENALRAQKAKANASISNALLQEQADLETQRGTALANAEAYKTQYLNDILSKVQALREQDYQQRYNEWYNAQQLALQQAQIAQSSRANDLQAKAQELQNQAYVDEYARTNLSNIYNNYTSMIESGNIQQAGQYLASQLTKLRNMGYDTSGLSTEFQNLYKRQTTEKLQSKLQSDYSKLYGSGLGGTIGGGLLTAAGILGAIPSAGATTPLIGLGLGGLSSGTKNISNAKKIRQQLEQNEDILSGPTPSWYSQYYDTTQ